MTYYNPPSNDDVDFELFSLTEKDNDSANIVLSPPSADDTPILSDISTTTTSQESVATTESVSEINPSSVSVSSIISIGEETVLDISNSTVELENESVLGQISGINATENDIVEDISFDSNIASVKINDASRNISTVSNESLTSFYEVPIAGIWEDSDYSEFDWQPSPPNTPYLELAEIEINSIADSSITVTEGEITSDVSTTTITENESLTFDRLIWDIQSWDQSSWQTSPPEYPLLTLTDIISDTKEESNVSISTSPPKSSTRSSSLSSTESVLFDRLSWNIQHWNKSTWQTSPPEYPELTLESIRAATIDDADKNIVTSKKLSSISSTTFQSTETEDLDDGSWETGLWDRFDWTLDVTTRIDRGGPEEIFSSPIQSEEIATASIVSVVEAFAATRVSSEFSSTLDGVTPIFQDISSSSVVSDAVGSIEDTPIPSTILGSGVQSTDDIEITSALSSVSPETSSVSTLVVGDEQTSAGDVPSLARPSGTPQSLDAVTSSVDTPTLPTIAGATQISTDVSTASAEGTASLLADTKTAPLSITSVSVVSVGDVSSQVSTETASADDTTLTQPTAVATTTSLEEASAIDAAIASSASATSASFDAITIAADAPTVVSPNVSVILATSSVDTRADIIFAAADVFATPSVGEARDENVLTETVIDTASAIDVSISTDDSFTETAVAAPRSIDAATASTEQNIVSSISVTTADSLDTSLTSDDSAVAAATASPINSTDQIEITNAIDAGTSATTIASVITVEDEQTTADEQPVISASIAASTTSADISAALDEAALSVSSISSQTDDETTLASDGASVTATTATVATIDATTIASDTGIEDVETLTQQSAEIAIAQDADIIEASDATTPSIDADTSATDADDITTIEETSATANEAISIALALVEGVETSLVASAVTSDGEQTSVAPATTPVSAVVVPQFINAFTSSLDGDIVSSLKASAQQGDEFASAVDDAFLQTVVASLKIIDANTIAIDEPTVASSVATPETIDAGTIAIDGSITAATVDTPTIDATTSALDTDNIAATVATVTDINAETRALEQPIVSIFDNSSILIDADTAAQDAATRSTPVASPTLIDADTSAQDAASTAASDITPLQGTDAIEIASAIPLIDPQTSVASIIASADEQTIATDAALRDDTNATVAQIDAFTSSFDPAGSRPIEAESAGIDADTLALDDSNVAESTSTIVDVIDTAVSVDDASKASVSVVANVSTEVALAAEIPGVEDVVFTPLSGTDIGEFASAFDISIQSSALALSIPSFDEDTSAVEVPLVSTPRADSLLLDAQATALEEDIVSQQTASTLVSIEDTTALEEGLLSGASVAGQQTTDEIEITSAISVISPESLDATPIISGDEDTSALEGGVLSLLKADDIVVDAGTSSIEEGVISNVLSVEPSPDEISMAQEEGEISISSISVADTTDEIEITSAISVISPETLTASPIILSDEDTSAFEEGGLSGLLTDAITVNADTSARERPVVSDSSVATGLLDDDVITVTSFGLVQDSVAATSFTSFESIDIIGGKESDIASVQIPANATLEIASALSGIELESATALVTTSIDDRALALDTDIEVSVIATILATGAEDEFAVPAGFASRGSVEFNSANSTTVITQPTRAETL